MAAKTVRDQFFKDLKTKGPGAMRVTESHLRALRIYFNNKARNHRAQRDKDMELIADKGPIRLCAQAEANFVGLLDQRCLLPDREWRNTDFTRRWGRRERIIFDNFRMLQLIGFRDEQGPKSYSWEVANRYQHEAFEVVPVYAMEDVHGQFFEFIIRPWQQVAQGKDPITFI